MEVPGEDTQIRRSKLVRSRTDSLRDVGLGRFRIRRLPAIKVYGEGIFLGSIW